MTEDFFLWNWQSLFIFTHYDILPWILINKEYLLNLLFLRFFASLEYCHGYFSKPSKSVYNWVPFMFLLQKRLLIQARVRNLHPAKLVNDFYVY